ncbi:heterokaryon incompatibility protein-domain-containing protein [Apiosordaria backusii]|uniref:Heterokaryon incompatibility protein-domain-containing protein n=1 Tax=Apiosordaria backusii TaxID=314023 RepID=A0AA40ESM5_9PEZI|nr:heterokaryon incompatibility protein-domain-containing protein [Apiosordaria backusii]
MNSFHYLPLKHDIREIRLLTLNYIDFTPEKEPANDSVNSSSINLTLTHASLDAQPTPAFSALSYVWGDATDTRSIFLDGNTFQVTKNLFTALTRLQTDKFNGHIWIDAVCINQSDNDEKSVQVQIMSYIYSRAAEVVIWLGPEPDYGALRSIQYLGTMFREQVRTKAAKGEKEFNVWADGFVKTVRQYAVTDGYGDISKPGFNFEFIWVFFRQRPWWRRVWIIQEVVLAKKATVLCGTASIPWEDVADNHDGGIQATNPRDRIYGLLGLVRLEDRQKITVDYTDNWSLNKILFQASKTIVMDHGPDALTYYQGPLTHEEHEAPAPSWVIDWTALRVLIVPGISLEDNESHYNKYNASKGARWKDWSSKCQIEQASFEQPQISLWGRTVAQVVAVGQEIVESPKSPGFPEAAGNWLLEIEGMVDKYQVSSSGLDSHTTLLNVWRVPMSDIGLIRRADNESPERFVHGFEVLTGRKQPPPELASEEERTTWIMTESWNFRRVWKVYGRRTFVDSTGRPGITHKDVQVGDHVVIFAGAHVPFVVRPITDKGGDVQYRFVGSAYVFGLMDGEAMEGEPDFEEVHLV